LLTGRGRSLASFTRRRLGFQAVGNEALHKRISVTPRPNLISEFLRGSLGISRQLFPFAESTLQITRLQGGLHSGRDRSDTSAGDIARNRAHAYQSSGAGDKLIPNSGIGRQLVFRRDDPVRNSTEPRIQVGNG